MTMRALRFVKQHYLRLNFSDLAYQLFLLFLGIITLFLIIIVKSKTATEFWSDPLLFFYTIFVTTFQLSRVVGAMFYKHSALKIMSEAFGGGHYEPSVTFVVPCKNEEKSIAKTIEKSFGADYPKNKIEVIVINDGSTDGTINVLNNLKKKFNNLIIIDWKINKGKRYGMAEGFRRATGEIIIQLDSDSYIDTETFRNLIKPFQNQKIGAICAHADPENADENLLTKMQAAYYFISFRILKAAESTFMAVFCCSGCSSAYRKSIILPILDEWLNEKFLGLPVTWGDDRALTNRVLKMGYKTIYTDEVQAYTICPNNLKTFLKQQVRWKKGWFVNSIFVSRFVYKKHPFVAATYFFPLIFVTLATPFMATRALIYNPIFRDVSPFLYIFGVFLVACVMVLYYRSVARDNKHWPYVFIWSAINMVVLSFILFYALATIQNRKWGTR
jgi:hyaluronan synthase